MVLQSASCNNAQIIRSIKNTFYSACDKLFIFAKVYLIVTLLRAPIPVKHFCRELYLICIYFDLSRG